MPTDEFPIIDVVLADINAVVPNFSSLVASYRLMVGAAEEVRRTSGVPVEIFQRAVLRYDRTGTLIDLLLELLCCKIVFASKFLSTVCAPIDLPRYFANTSDADYTPQHTAEQIVLIEVLRLLLTTVCEDSPCFGAPPPGIGCPQPAPPCPPVLKPATTQPGKPPAGGEEALDADAQDLLAELAPVLITDITDTSGLANTVLIPGRPGEDRITRKHYQKGACINKKWR